MSCCKCKNDRRCRRRRKQTLCAMKLSLIETNQEEKKYALVARFVSTLIRALNLAPKRLFKMHFRRFRLSFHLFFSSRFCLPHADMLFPSSQLQPIVRLRSRDAFQSVKMVNYATIIMDNEAWAVAAISVS